MELLLISFMALMISICCVVSVKMFQAQRQDRKVTINASLKCLFAEIAKKTRASATTFEAAKSEHSFSRHTCSSSDFFCAYLTPVNCVIEEVGSPKLLRSLSGWIEDPDERIPRLLLATYLHVPQKSVTKVSFMLSMSDDTDARERELRGMHYEIMLHDASGVVVFKHAGIADKARMEEGGFDQLFSQTFDAIPCAMPTYH